MKSMANTFFRAVAATPKVSVGDVKSNITEILKILEEVRPMHPDLVVFPETSLTAYTCGDLFHNAELLEGARRGLKELVEKCPPEIPLVIAGMPLAVSGAIYNCAVGFCRNKILGIVPKSYIPNYNEFYERRWFAPAERGREVETVEAAEGYPAPFSPEILFNVDGVRVGAEICEDLWVPVPPSCAMAMNGAEVIANLSASDDIVGKYSYLKGLIEQQSARCICGYVYASSGFGESSTDLVFDGKDIICENGVVLAESDRFRRGNKYAVADIDVDSLRRDRRHLTTFADCSRDNRRTFLTVNAGKAADRELSPENIIRKVNALPFVPGDPAKRAERCEEILHIQKSGLAKRLDATGCRKIIVGISGGLDSTLALLVAVGTFDMAGYDRKGIIGVTMPGFGTTGRTRSNAVSLMNALGVTTREIPIAEAVRQHFRDIGHNPTVTDVTYENSQARERTQILMDLANKEGGMVLGTGDLSELALGWATYNGDHISMYGVNAGVPKTLVRHLVKYFADEQSDENCRAILYDICDTPISPELIPADSQGNIVQKTEDLVGPYELHDFFLYRMLRHGEAPGRIYLLAQKAFAGIYEPETIKHWLRVFIRRFFAQQFKRSCLPDGPKVGSVTLSPRGDWRMPSDASAALWLNAVDKL